MDRRRFLQAMVAAGITSAARAEELLSMGDGQRREMERRALGRTGEKLSRIGFGGIIVMNEPQRQANEYVAEAFDRGVNYFDVAPTYGDAEARLGPALKPYRDRCFLACKSDKRDAEGSRAQLEESLRLLETDHFDLYQLHAITSEEEARQTFGPGGAMETLIEAREEGKVRYLGFSAHSHLAANIAMDNFDFDSILFPFSYVTWQRAGFGPEVYRRAKEREMGLLALKAMACGKWPEGTTDETKAWKKTWYRPFDQPETAQLGLRFALHQPVTAALPPGHWELFALALELNEAGLLDDSLGEQELAMLDKATLDAAPIFDTPRAAA